MKFMYRYFLDQAHMLECMLVKEGIISKCHPTELSTTKVSMRKTCTNSLHNNTQTWARLARSAAAKPHTLRFRESGEPQRAQRESDSLRTFLPAGSHVIGTMCAYTIQPSVL